MKIENGKLRSAVSSIFPTLGSGLANALSGTSYASEDTDLLGVDEDYTALEIELAQTVANIESTHPGYDEYRNSVDEIGHNPYEPAAPGFRKDPRIQTYLLKRMPKTWKKDPLQKRKIV